ncbi:MAG TPA: (2Fe-2S)-binding protein, partial [Planctomycetota bacterium]|nr:(2Fe-2S)-binding protein [Planctomycetota bacterium]
MDQKDKDSAAGGVSRRGFLKGAGLSVAATGLLGATRQGIRESAGLPAAPLLKAGDTHTITFVLNGVETSAKVRTGHTLLETLRDQLNLTGTKLVCDQGSCGACTVLLDGKPTNSCLTLAVDAAGRKVETVEGLAKGGKLHPIQEAFCEHDALQCGFCTPGMLMSCKALLDRNPTPNRDQTKAALAGNICRCGTYINIFDAVAAV